MIITERIGIQWVMKKSGEASGTPVEPVNSSRSSAGPDKSGAILGNGGDVVVGQAGRIERIMQVGMKPIPIISYQSADCAEPDEAVVILYHAVDAALQNAIASRDMLDTKPCVLCMQHQRCRCDGRKADNYQ
jgi:hypothetical protein